MDAVSRLAAIVESSDDAIIAKDMDGKITAWNFGAQQMYGYTAKEAIGRSFAFLIPPENSGEGAVILEKIRRGERFAAHETTRVCKDGRRISVSMRFAPLRDGSGALVGASAIARDITSILRGDEALRRSVAELQRSQEIARVGSYRLDIPADHYACTPVMDEVFGIDGSYPHTVPGWLALVHPQDREAVGRYFAEEVVAKRRPFDRQYRIVRPSDHVVRWIHGRGLLEFGPDGSPQALFGTIHDITDSKQSEEA
jgi:PAS domain S-box-containing protein